MLNKMKLLCSIATGLLTTWTSVAISATPSEICNPGQICHCPAVNTAPNLSTQWQYTGPSPLPALTEFDQAQWNGQIITCIYNMSSTPIFLASYFSTNKPKGGGWQPGTPRNCSGSTTNCPFSLIPTTSNSQ